MNRDMFYLITTMQQSKLDLNEMSEWARLEHLYNCDVFAKRTSKRIHFRHSFADCLRRIADRVEPLQIPSRQTQI